MQSTGVSTSHLKTTDSNPSLNAFPMFFSIALSQKKAIHINNEAKLKFTSCQKLLLTFVTNYTFEFITLDTFRHFFSVQLLPIMKT